MKKRMMMAVKILIIVALLAGLAFLIRYASDIYLVVKYDASAPTATKYAKLAKWVPSKANMFVAIDVKRLLDEPTLKERLLDILKGQQGVVADLSSALLEKQNLVGMVAVAGDVGNSDKFPSIAFIAQGAFDEKTLIPSIRTILAAGRAGLAAEEIGGHKLYTESDSRDPIGFIVLDREHIAAGTRAALIDLYGENVAGTPSVGSPADSVFFGHITIVPRIKEFLPMGLDRLDNVDFKSPDGRTFVAVVPCKDMTEIINYQMFLEGVRSLLLVQQEGNAALTNILKGIAISPGNGEVTISTDILPLLDLIPQPAGASEG